MAESWCFLRMVCLVCSLAACLRYFNPLTKGIMDFNEATLAPTDPGACTLFDGHFLLLIRK
jgi:hypothetical protein